MLLLLGASFLLVASCQAQTTNATTEHVPMIEFVYRNQTQSCSKDYLIAGEDYFYFVVKFSGNNSEFTYTQFVKPLIRRIIIGEVGTSNVVCDFTPPHCEPSYSRYSTACFCELTEPNSPNGPVYTGTARIPALMLYNNFTFFGAWPAERFALKRTQDLPAPEIRENCTIVAGDNGGLSAGAVAGIVIGVVALVGVVGAAAVYFLVVKGKKGGAGGGGGVGSKNQVEMNGQGKVTQEKPREQPEIHTKVVLPPIGGSQPLSAQKMNGTALTTNPSTNNPSTTTVSDQPDGNQVKKMRKKKKKRQQHAVSDDGGGGGEKGDLAQEKKKEEEMWNPSRGDGGDNVESPRPLPSPSLSPLRSRPLPSPRADDLPVSSSSTSGLPLHTHYSGLNGRGLDGKSRPPSIETTRPKFLYEGKGVEVSRGGQTPSNVLPDIVRM